MSLSSITNLTLNITEILMDRENPRHDEIDGQRDILNWHATMLGDELIQLMRSIALHGLSDIEKILVQPMLGSYVVKEGNRRIAALKLLHDPSLCDDPLFRRKIESVSLPANFAFEFACICCTDHARVLWMMGLRHLGQQGGVGTHKWGASEKSRHQQDYAGKARYWRSLYFIDYALKNNLIADQQAARLQERISNLDRLVPSAEFKQALGVTYKDNMIKVSLEKRLHDKVLSIILQKISDPNFNVSKIYKSDDKISFLTKAIDEAKTETTTIEERSPQQSHQPDRNSEPKERSKEQTKEKSNDESTRFDKLYPKIKSRKLPCPSQRETLFIGSISIPNGHPKCSRLYRQIDSLKIADHGLVIACAARALIDISAQVYIDRFNIAASSKSNSHNQMPLPEMVKLSAKNLHAEKRISSELHNVILHGEAANPQSILHPRTFHAFMHGRYDNSMNTLREAWERCYEEFLRALWLHIKESD